MLKFDEYMSGQESFKEKDQRWAELMRQAQGGDSQSYEKLLEELMIRLRAFINKRVSDAEAVEDLLQEVLMGIHKARHTYDPSQTFGGWAFAIARYKLTDYYRKRSRRLGKEIHSENMEHYAVAEEPKTEELSDELAAALMGLKPKARKAVELLKIEGKSVKEAADEMGISKSAVKVTAHRAYKEMRKKLDKGSYDEN